MSPSKYAAAVVIGLVLGAALEAIRAEKGQRPDLVEVAVAAFLTGAIMTVAYLVVWS